MKIRNGFVSNSSSSSFLIPINALKDYQIMMIQNYIANNNEWGIDLNDKCLYGWSFEDNFDTGEIEEFFEELKINDKYIYWDGQLDLDLLNKEILQEERKDKLNNLNEI